MRSILAHRRCACGCAVCAYHFSRAIALEIPPLCRDRKSGYDFMARETRAMQDDDTANAGMLWVLDGETLWNRDVRRRRQIMRRLPWRRPHQHEGRRRALSGVQPGARPAGQSRSAHQHVPRRTASRPSRFAYESKDLLALTAFVGRQSRGVPIAVADDEHTRKFDRERPRRVHAPAGPAQSLLRAMPRRQLERPPRGQPGDAGPADRLSDLSPGMAEPRIAAAAAAQLPHRHAHGLAGARRTGTGRARALFDVAGARHADGDAGCATLSLLGPGLGPGTGPCSHLPINLALIRPKFFHIAIRDEGGSIVPSTPVCCCRDSIVADRRRIFVALFRGSGRTGPRSTPAPAKTRPSSRSCPRRSRRGRARRCASSSPRRSRSRASFR